jgi:hypothetical protein
VLLKALLLVVKRIVHSSVKIRKEERCLAEESLGCSPILKKQWIAATEADPWSYTFGISAGSLHTRLALAAYTCIMMHKKKAPNSQSLVIPTVNTGETSSNARLRAELTAGPQPNVLTLAIELPSFFSSCFLPNTKKQRVTADSAGTTPQNVRDPQEIKDNMRGAQPRTKPRAYTDNGDGDGGSGCVG